MKPLSTLVRIRLTALALAAASLGTAHAVPVTGTFNSAGYSIFSFTLATASIVDLQSTTGYADPTLSIFSSSGVHLITNDDANSSLLSHITQNLAAGSYSVLVSYCCNSANYAINNGAVFGNTDGFSTGTYWTGGTGTLSGMQANLLAITTGAGGAAWGLNSNITPVPEPGTMPLLAGGLALLAWGAQRRHRAS